MSQDKKRNNYDSICGKTPHFTIENNILKGEVVHDEKVDECLGVLLLKYLNIYRNKTAVINAQTKESYNFGQIRDQSIRCALWLQQHNIGVGDIITVFSKYRVENSVLLLASLFVGATFAPMNYGINTKNVEYYLKMIQPKVIFIDEDCYEMVTEAIQNTNSKTKIVVYGNVKGKHHFSHIIEEAATIQGFECQQISSLKQTAIILFSSGTSGLSKGVELSHETIIKALQHFELWGSNFTISLWYSPISWITGVYMILNSVVKGTTRIFHPTFEPQSFCNLVETYKVTYTIISGTMLCELHSADIVHKYDFSHLKMLSTAGMKISKSVMDYFVKALPHVCVHQLYGMTEVGNCALLSSKDKSKKDSAGTVPVNTEIKIVDPETQNVLGPESTGEIYIKSPTTMTGYYKNAEETDKVMDKNTGWMRTGDLGYYDNEGYIFIVDRLKEILKVRSHHISPSKIEHVLMQHPGVLEAVVVGVPHYIDGDNPIAFVSTAPKCQVTEQEILDLAASLGEFYKLRAGVVFLDKLPHTTSHKLDRKEIKNMAKEHMKSNKLYMN